jgi:hypothetical protein
MTCVRAIYARVTARGLDNKRRTTMTIKHLVSGRIDHIDRITAAIKEIGPHIEALHSQVIHREDKAAWGKLIALANAATELVDEIYRQDFIMIDRYVVSPQHPALPD